MAECEATMIRRRRFLQLAGAAFAQAAVSPARAAEALQVRVVTNGGVENDTLIELIERQGFLRSVGVSQTLVVVGSPAATLEALVGNRGDICVVSGFNGVRPRWPSIRRGLTCAACRIWSAGQSGLVRTLRCCTS